MRTTAEMRSAAREVAAAEVGPAKMATAAAEVGPTEMATATTEVGTTTTDVGTTAEMAAATVRCAAAVTSAAPAASLRRRISGGGQNGHKNENDEGSKFCHDYSIDLANELREQLWRCSSEITHARCRSSRRGPAAETSYGRRRAELYWRGRVPESAGGLCRLKKPIKES
jgi:hypothetical protein